MAEDNHGTEAELTTLFETGANKCGSYAFALMLWFDGHRCEARDPQGRVSGKRHRRKHDVADDASVVYGDQRHNCRHLLSQGVNEIGLGWRRKG